MGAKCLHLTPIGEAGDSNGPEAGGDHRGLQVLVF